MTISIIIPVYNVEKYLRQCIDSVLSQTFQDFEIILVDDGSTDSSGEICDEYVTKDDRIRVIHKANEGVSIARNIGIEMTSGELLMFLDSDDFLYPDALKVLYEASIETPCADIIISGMEKYFVSTDTKELFNLDANIYSKSLFGELSIYLKKKYFYGMVWSKLYKKEIISNNQIKFNENISYHEDELFFTQTLNASSNVKIISNTTYIYNRYDGTLTHRFVCPEIQLYTANMIYDEAKKISKKSEYHNYIMQEYANSLFNIIISMYSLSFYNKLSYKQRIEAIRKILKTAENRHISKNLNLLLNKAHFCSLSTYSIEAVGTLKYLKNIIY